MVLMASIPKPKPLTKEDLKVGHLYRGKRFTEILGYTNDRVIIWMGSSWKGDMVQYDSDSVRDGRHYPTVTVEQFLKWAKEEIQDGKSDNKG